MHVNGNEMMITYGLPKITHHRKHMFREMQGGNELIYPFAVIKM
jgi:hypothetical protein